MWSNHSMSAFCVKYLGRCTWSNPKVTHFYAINILHAPRTYSSSSRTPPSASYTKSIHNQGSNLANMVLSYVRIISIRVEKYTYKHLRQCKADNMNQKYGGSVSRPAFLSAQCQLVFPECHRSIASGSWCCYVHMGKGFLSQMIWE